MIKNIIIKIGCVLLMILKGIVWSVLAVLNLVMRVFLAFVRVGTA